MTALVAAAGLALPAALAAARRPLVPHVPVVSVRGESYSVETDASTGDLVIRYRQGERPVVVTYQPPNKLDLTVEAAVALDAAQGVFAYRYALTNSARSPQPVTAFVVESEAAMFDLVTPRGWRFRPMVPFPAGMWSNSGGAAGLAPGKTLVGFAWSASGQPIAERFFTTGQLREGYFHDRGSLPGIVDCHAVGHDEVVRFPAEPPAGVEEALPRFPRDGVGGRTVGPVAVPHERETRAMAERLVAYVRESRELGWIGNEAAARRYGQAVEQVRRAVESTEPQAASALLTALEGQLEADLTAGSLTSEAHALLKHNGRYLRDLLTARVR